MINALLLEDKKWSREEKEGGEKMEREREDSSQESGVEKVNNGRIDEIAMGD